MEQGSLTDAHLEAHQRDDRRTEPQQPRARLTPAQRVPRPADEALLRRRRRPRPWRRRAAGGRVACGDLAVGGLYGQQKHHRQADAKVHGAVRPEEMEEVYRWLYDNIELFGDDETQDSAVIIIKQGMVDHTLVVDPEINLAATLIKLARL